MKTTIIKFPVINELDIVLVHRRASQLCEFTGIGISDKTRFATAISEICRNCVEYGTLGEIEFILSENTGQFVIEVIILDQGPGIKNLDEIIAKQQVNTGNRGAGILHSRKLVDVFNIQSSTRGTVVSLGMKVPTKHAPINGLIVKGWIDYFKKNVPVSPYDDIKKQNIQLLEVTQELQVKNKEAENQIEEINALNYKLQIANQEMEDFTYTVSHDLKTPLSNIESLIYILKHTEDPKKKENVTNLIEVSVQKLKHTIKMLVEIIDIQNTEGDLVKEISFEQLYHSIADQYASEIIESGAILTTCFASKTIKYYEAYLRSIMQNLINNAIKYRENDRILELEVSTRAVDGLCILKIQDNGKGMDMKRVGEKLFKPFMRFDTKKEGKGIGLHLVKSMVEKNGGHIEVESQVDLGTAFTVYLKEY